MRKNKTRNNKKMYLMMAAFGAGIGFAYYFFTQRNNNEGSLDLTQDNTKSSDFFPLVSYNVLSTFASLFTVTPQKNLPTGNIPVKKTVSPDSLSKEAVIAKIKEKQSTASENSLMKKLEAIQVMTYWKDELKESQTYIDKVTTLIKETLPHCMPANEWEEFLALKTNIAIDVTSNPKFLGPVANGRGAQTILEEKNGVAQIFISKPLMQELLSSQDKSSARRFLANEIHHAKIMGLNLYLGHKHYLPFRNDEERKALTSVIAQCLKDYIFSLSSKEILDLPIPLSSQLSEFSFYSKGPIRRVRDFVKGKDWGNKHQEKEIWELNLKFINQKNIYSEKNEDSQIAEQDSDMASIYALMNDKHKKHFAPWHDYHKKYMKKIQDLIKIDQHRKAFKVR